MFRGALWMPCFAVLLRTSSFSQNIKSPVPDKAIQEKLTRKLKALFESEYSKRDVGSRREFAKTLLTEAAETSDVNKRFVMLVEAWEMAAQSGEDPEAQAALGDPWYERSKNEPGQNGRSRP